VLAKRLTIVDLPTLGRPIIATIGRDIKVAAIRLRRNFEV
jgi:hypothetical protein